MLKVALKCANGSHQQSSLVFSMILSNKRSSIRSRDTIYMFITPAFADTVATGAANAAAAAADAPTGIAGILASPAVPVILVIIVFYFMVIMPQNKRAQEHRKMIADLQKGDKVVTGGGLIATVKKVVSDEEVVLELAEGVQVHALRSTIMTKRAQ